MGAGQPHQAGHFGHLQVAPDEIRELTERAFHALDVVLGLIEQPIGVNAVARPDPDGRRVRKACEPALDLFRPDPVEVLQIDVGL